MSNPRHTNLNRPGESQRDSALQPRVASSELPWENRQNNYPTLKGLWQDQGSNHQLSTIDYQLPERHSPLEIRHSARGGFSLIEIMITVALLSFIILGLLAMFNQVQRAFRSSMTQVDVLESGRAVTDMLARDLEQIYPTRYPNPDNNGPSTNFVAVVNTKFAQPMLQGLPGTTDATGPNQGPYRTNLIQTLFFTTRYNQDFIGNGYFVYPDSVDNAGVGLGVGTLYRFTTNRSKNTSAKLFGDFTNTIQNIFQNGTTNMPASVSRIADGVIDFRFRTFDTNGVVMIPYGNGHLAFWIGTNINPIRVAITNGYGDYFPSTDQMNYWYVSNAVPASVELELAFVEQRIIDRFKGIGSVNQPAQRTYLSNHVAEVHVFKQRIPIRNIDFQAYQ